MASENYTTEEGSFKAPKDGYELYTKTWRPISSIPAKARLIFIHGFSDHVNFQGPLFPLLAEKGIITYTFDQRGWGRSFHKPAEKGKTGPTEQVMKDINDFITSTLDLSDKKPQEKDLPVFMMGHSMGGQETLYFASTGPKETLQRIRGFLVEAPFVALHPRSRPSSIIVVLGRLAGRFLPHFHKAGALDPYIVARDPKVGDDIKADPLCHDTGTLEGLAGMLDRALALENGEVTVPEGQGEGGKTRIWFGMGTQDLICDYNAARKHYEMTKVQDKEFQVYEGWYHKLHLEPGEDKVRFCNDVAKWVLDRAGTGTGSETSTVVQPDDVPESADRAKL
jgi:acylglycerol lipase